MLSAADLMAIELTLKLALLVTVLLLLLGVPLAWWLTQTRSRFKGVVSALVALPLVLPPTVLGFYLLLAMGPEGPLGKVMQFMGLDLLPFSFSGLVVASVIYSLPFVVQPVHNAMVAMGKGPLEVAASLGAGAFDRFFTVVLPLSMPGIITAAVLGFAHTIGEFGVVLMIGGNIPGETRVISVQIYDHVEALEYGHAHMLSGLMLLFAFVVLLLLSGFQQKRSLSLGNGGI